MEPYGFIVIFICYVMWFCKLIVGITSYAIVRSWRSQFGWNKRSEWNLTIAVVFSSHWEVFLFVETVLNTLARLAIKLRMIISTAKRLDKTLILTAKQLKEIRRKNLRAAREKIMFLHEFLFVF